MRYWIAALVLACIGLPAAAQTFSNTTTIGIPDGGGVESVINVSGLTGTISSLSLTLNGVNHSFANDLVFGLVAENAKVGFVFWSDAGGAYPISNATLTFTDSASQFLPPSTDDTPITTGTYLPSNWGLYGLLGVTNATFFSDFNGLNPNDAWTLVAFDVAELDFGTVNGGWSLSFTTSGGAGAVPEPASWAMLIGGFALAGGAIRRRRTPDLAAA